MFPNGRSEMSVCVVLLAVLSLLNRAQRVPQGGDSVIVRDPDISASWYTGRGIRPLGRFGRKAARRNKFLCLITARVYRRTADSSVRITQ